MNFRVKWEVAGNNGCCVGAYKTAWTACQAAMQAICTIADSESAMRTSLAEVRYSIWEGDEYRGAMPTPENYNSFYRGAK
jgi:hypothetical protein